MSSDFNEDPSTPMEVLYVGGVIAIAPMLIRSLLKQLLFRSDRYWPIGYLSDAISTLLPTLLLMTGSVSPQGAFQLTTCLTLCLSIPSLFSMTEEKALNRLGDLTRPRLRYLDDFRGDFMLATCMGILAVDFSTFPKHFAKSESYGTTVMDLGPGVIIFAGGLVAKPISKGKMLQKMLCLVCFGLVRLMVTLLTNYTVNENEYGRHWNFFFTLAGVTFLRALIPVHDGLFAMLLASLTLYFYQSMLNSGLEDYLHSEDHEGSLLDQNKEGVYSLLGYWCLHILGACVGRFLRSTAAFCLQRMESRNANSITSISARFWLFIWYFLVLGLTHILLAFTQMSNNNIDDASRRSCNVTYVLWMCAFSMTQCLWKITIRVLNLEDSVLLTRAINSNLLGVFLVANLMTGIVNLSMETQLQDTTISSIVLIAYGVVLTSGAVFAELNAIYLKL